MLRYSVRQTIAPSEDPVSVAEAKAHIGLPAAGSAHDAELDILIKAATDYTQKATGRQWELATYEMQLEQFPVNNMATVQGSRMDRYPLPIIVPVNPFQNLAALTYIDLEGTGRDFFAEVDPLYDKEPGWVIPLHGTRWPEDVRGRFPNTVTLTWQAGYITGEVPQAARLAILQLVHHWFDTRAAGTAQQIHEVPMQVRNLLTSLSVGVEWSEFAV